MHSTAQHTFKCEEFVSATADHMLMYPCNTRIEVKETFARRWAAGGATAKKFLYSSNRHFYQKPLKSDFYQKPLKSDFYQKPLKSDFCQKPLKSDFYKKPLKSHF